MIILHARPYDFETIYFAFQEEGERDFFPELSPGEPITSGAETYTLGGIADTENRDARFCYE
jgi:hypothetical protein